MLTRSKKRKFVEITKIEKTYSKYDDLHSKGYLILEKAFEASDKVVNYFRSYIKKKSYTIFNNEKNDYKRCQNKLILLVHS